MGLNFSYAVNLDKATKDTEILQDVETEEEKLETEISIGRSSTTHYPE